MICSYCGAEIDKKRAYCLVCGTRQEPEKEVPQPEELPVSPRYTPAPLRQDVKPLPPLEEDGEIPEEKAGEEQIDGIRVQLPVGRSWVKMLLLGLITAGIYPTVIWSRIVTELNITASGNDGMRTMPYFAMMLLSPVTLFIYPFVWMHRFCRRVGAQLRFRNISYRFGAKDFWLWCVLGSLILAGPLVFVHKLMKSMNFINADYNTCG